MTFWTVWILTMLGVFNWDDCRITGSTDIGGHQVKTWACGTPSQPLRARR